MPPRLWVDVEDLFDYARENVRPSGIQRVAFEIYRALAAHDAGSGKIHFVRHAPFTNSFRVISWSEIETLFTKLTDNKVAATIHSTRILPHGSSRQTVRKLVQRIPASIRPQIIDLLLTNARAMRAWRRFLVDLTRVLGGLLLRTLSPAKDTDAVQKSLHTSTESLSKLEFASAAAPGDVLLVLGSPWSHPDYAALVRAHRQRYGLRFAMLVYDLIPLRRPEWCDASLVRLFREWIDPMLPLCDKIFAISRATAADVESYSEEHGAKLSTPVIALPIGTGFHYDAAHIQAGCHASKHATQSPSRILPATGTYALIVSTIEARKNHQLLFRVWRRLLEDLPEDQVPTLVFAGRVGWLVDDLMRQISNTENLNGKLILVENPTDAELVRLYKGCLFTLFPSFYEGWGLPVTESLAFGKPAVISNRTSLPEAGGVLARSFDPDNLLDAYQVIRNVIEDRSGLASWEQQVIREFASVPWSMTAEAILAGLDGE